jgi:hypothetical protein
VLSVRGGRIDWHEGWTDLRSATTEDAWTYESVESALSFLPEGASPWVGTV